MKSTIEQIAREDGRYDAKALKFVYEGLGRTVQKIREDESDEGLPRHISGQELALGLAEIAVERWGRLARTVLKHWGIETSRDMGEVVYLMIAHKWMSAQETDTIEDFDNVFDFETMFEKNFVLEIQQ